jgi:hypothetical protein
MAGYAEEGRQLVRWIAGFAIATPLIQKAILWVRGLSLYPDSLAIISKTIH